MAALQFFARMHKLLILVIPGSKALHLCVIACYLRYVIDVCKKSVSLSIANLSFLPYDISEG